MTFLIRISSTNAIYLCTQDRCVSCNKDLSKLKLPRFKISMNGSKQANALVQCDCMSAPAYKLLEQQNNTALKHSLRGNCHWADSNRTSNDAQILASYQDEMTKLVTDRHKETLMIQHHRQPAAPKVLFAASPAANAAKPLKRRINTRTPPASNFEEK